MYIAVVQHHDLSSHYLHPCELCCQHYGICWWYNVTMRILVTKRAHYIANFLRN